MNNNFSKFSVRDWERNICISGKRKIFASKFVLRPLVIWKCVPRNADFINNFVSESEMLYGVELIKTRMMQIQNDCVALRCAE
jgi:hypothetical protein